jgi:hypothetical protein
MRDVRKLTAQLQSPIGRILIKPSRPAYRTRSTLNLWANDEFDLRRWEDDSLTIKSLGVSSYSYQEKKEPQSPN